MSHSLKIGLIDGDRHRVEAVVKRCCIDGNLEVAWATDRWDRYPELRSKTRPGALVIDVDLDAVEPSDLISSETGPSSRTILIATELPSPGLDRFRLLRPYAVLLKQDPLSTLLLYLKQIQAESKSIAAPAPPAFTEGRRFRLDSPLNVLTARQVQILKCLARGDSVKEAATQLALTAKSVTNHKYRIMQKLGVDDRVKLARLAIREGLIEA